MKDWTNAALVLIYFAVILVSFGCAPATDYPDEVDSSQSEGTSGPRRGTSYDLGDGVWVWTDPETGCEYLLLYTKGITSRMESHLSRGSPQRHKGCLENNNRELSE